MDKVLSTDWTSLLKLFPPHWQDSLYQLDCLEIRVRTGKPVQIVQAGKEVMLPLIASSQDIQHLVSAFSGSSLYAFEEELRQGFITLPGGHRVGFAGKAMLDEKGHIRGLKHISTICLRVAKSVKGCADKLWRDLLDAKGCPYHTLVISPPQAGKTTLLRDMARQLSDRGLRVCIVDERSEIAGCYNGSPQLDVGLRTDVLDGCPKAQGMLMALRALSPEVIVTDEVGRSDDAAAIEEALNSGVRVIASAHGSSYEEVAARPNLSNILERGLFQRIVILSNRRGPGTMEYIGGVFSAHKGEQHHAHRS